MKNLIIITICFMVIGMQSLFAQHIVPFERSAEYSVSPPASQAPIKSDGSIFGPMRNDGWGGDIDQPGGGGTGGIAPVAEGCWVLASLAVVYGIARRKGKIRVKDKGSLRSV